MKATGLFATTGTMQSVSVTAHRSGVGHRRPHVTSSAWTPLPVPLTFSAGAHTATFEYRFNPGSCTLDFDVATLNP